MSAPAPSRARSWSRRIVAVIIQQSWSGLPVTGSSILGFLITGIALGSIYGVAAQGLVVTYATSGVFNFAQGAIGMFLAFVYWEFRVDIGLPTIVGLLLTVLVAAPLHGRADRAGHHAVPDRLADRRPAGRDDRPDARPDGPGGVASGTRTASRTPSPRSSAPAASTSAARSCPYYRLDHDRHRHRHRAAAPLPALPHAARHHHAGGRRQPRPRPCSTARAGRVSAP